MVRYDEVGSISRKLKSFFFNMDITILIIMVGRGICFINGSYESICIVTAQSIVTAVVTTVIVYVYFKKDKKIKIKEKVAKKRFYS